MRVLTFSRTFPAHHPKAGQPTWFVDKILHSISFPDYKHSIDIDNPAKYTTIRRGNLWKVGDKVSARYWSEIPYRSKQVEFAQLEVRKTWKFETALWIGCNSKNCYSTWYMDGKEIGVLSKDLLHTEGWDLINTIAENDGLSITDLLSWFKHPSNFNGQIICWNENINY